MYLGIIKTIPKKAAANITLNGEKLKACFSMTKKKRIALLFNIALEVLAYAIREEKEIK
jgi:hypothetical protein